MSARAYLRVVDANFNRAKEALRVGEEILRLVVNSRVLAHRCKFLRHRLTRIFLNLPVPYDKIISARDSRRDVGRKSMMKDRRGPRTVDLFLANMKRAQESLRVLEEFSRVLFPKQVASIEGIRFSCYELEKKALKKF